MFEKPCFRVLPVSASVGPVGQAAPRGVGEQEALKRKAERLATRCMARGELWAQARKTPRWRGGGKREKGSLDASLPWGGTALRQD